VFSNSDGQVTILDPSQLESGLSPTIEGTVLASVVLWDTVPAAVVHELHEVGVDSGLFSRDVVHVDLLVNGPLSASEPDVIDVAWDNEQGLRVDTTLTETGPATHVFADPTGTSILEIPLDQPFGTTEGVLQVVATSADLGIDGVELFVLETEVGSGQYETTEQTTIDSFDRPTFAGWQFSATPGTPVQSSNGGEFNAYALQVLGPSSLLDGINHLETLAGPRPVKRAFDGNYYVFTNPVSISLIKEAGLDSGASSGTTDPNTAFLWGYTKGFFLGGWSLVEGTFSLGSFAIGEGARLSPWGFVIVMTVGDEYESEARWARSARDAALTMAAIAQAIQQDQDELILALLAGDEESVGLISAPYRMGLEFSVELLKALGEEYEVSPPEEQGEIFGRAMFEVFSFAVVYAKLGQVTKLGFLNGLKAKPFFQQPRVAQAFSKITGFLDDLAVTRMCFVAGTQVHTASGLKSIEDLRAGDRVLSRDPRTREQAYQPVVRTVTTRPTRLYHVRYRARAQTSGGSQSGASSSDESNEDGDDEGEPRELVATGEHPFFVVEADDFVAAERLKAGDILAMASGGLAEVVGVEVEEAASEPFTTYNIEVDGFGTYFVGDDGVWVHNAAGRECAQIRSIYLRRKSRGKTPNEIFRWLEQKLPGVGKNKKLMGSALDEAFEKEVFPGTANVWTKGPEASPGANAWGHFRRHVRRDGHFPGIDDAVTYVEQARRFLARQGPSVRRGIRRSRGSGLRERFVIDLDTGEFAVEMLDGEVGALKTYFRVDGGPQEWRAYFHKQF
jgi:hypothetical protein